LGLLPAIGSLPRIVPGDDPRSQRADDAGWVATATTLAGRSLIPPRRHRPRCSLRCHRRDRPSRRRQPDVVANHDRPGRLQLGLARRGLGRVVGVRNLTLEPGHRRSAPMHHRLLWWSVSLTVILQSVAAAGALLSSDDYGSSVERAAKLHPLWQMRCPGVAWSVG
jgi:hypothetical protein